MQTFRSVDHHQCNFEFMMILSCYVNKKFYIVSYHTFSKTNQTRWEWHYNTLYIAATHNITHSPCISTCTTHPALPTPLPSTTLLCTQLTNTTHICVKWRKMWGWCESVVVSFSSSLVGFWGFHSYMHLFSFKKRFVTCIYEPRRHV